MKILDPQHFVPSELTEPLRRISDELVAAIAAYAEQVLPGEEVVLRVRRERSGIGHPGTIAVEVDATSDRGDVSALFVQKDDEFYAVPTTASRRWGW